MREEYPKIVAAVALVCGDRGAAEDAVQTALAEAWLRSGRGSAPANPAAWVTRVAMNRAVSGFRRRLAERRAHDRLARATGPHDPPSDLDLERAVSALPMRQRQVVVLRYLLQFDVAEIAALLGVHAGTVKTSLHRARTSMAAALAEDLEEEEQNAGS